MGKFKKGESGNPDGRPPGSRNKTGNDVREMIGVFIAEKLPYLFKMFDKMEAKEQRIFITDLMPYYIPKHQSIDMGISENDIDAAIAKIESTISKCQG